MVMVFCRACGKEIHDSATACPNCGAAQVSMGMLGSRSKWMAITSLVLSILVIMASMSTQDAGADVETIWLIALLGVGSLVFSTISLAQKRWGSSLAILGIVLSVLGVFGARGL